MRRRPRTDANQHAIIHALRRAGAEVTILSAVGGGVPDLLVSFAGRWHVIEVKDGAKPPSQRALTIDQRAWIARQRAPVLICETDLEAVHVIGAVQLS